MGDCWLMMNSHRVLMKQRTTSDLQFLNFVCTRLCSQQISLPQIHYFQPPLKQIPPPYTQRKMFSTDGHMQQPNDAFWDKFKDIRKRAQEFEDSKVVNKNMKMEAIVTTHQSSCGKDPADDYQRRPKWKKTHYGRMSGYRGQGHLFSVCSYNILAQNLLEMHPDLYTHCTPEYLDWEYRKKNLLNELKSCQADIMCLQEVQEEHFLKIFKPEFRKLGFSCVYKKRTGDKQDGCAIFYRDQSFQLETCRYVEYYHPHVYLLDRDNIGLIVILKSKNTHGKLCIANTHLLFNPRRGDVKLAQLSNLFAEIDKVAYETTDSRSGHCPIIICGDFNSEPKSPLCSFIENSSLDYCDMMSGEICKPPWTLEDTRPRRRGTKLYVPLLPKHVGISETCQYMHVIEQRRELQRKHSNNNKERSENEGSQNKKGSKVENQLVPTTGEARMDKHCHLSQLAGKDAAVSSRDSESTSSAQEEATRKPLKPSEHPPTGRLHHNLNVESAYQQLDGFVTTHHTRTKCVVDFMFNSRARKDQRIADLKRIAWLPLFTNEDADKMGGLPNKHWSSDHYRLQVKYLLRSPNDTLEKRK